MNSEPGHIAKSCGASSSLSTHHCNYGRRAALVGTASYLAPDIAQAILDGRQPRDLTADKLLAHSRLPLAWYEQRSVLGFA